MPYNLLALLRPAVYRYLAAILLAVAAQVVRISLRPPTVIPFVTYGPFVVISALLGGLGPGLLTTILCTLEIVYFAPEPIGSFAVNDASWQGIGAFAFRGVVMSVLAESLKRDRLRLSESQRKTNAFLESISDGFNAFDREWRYTYVNSAAAIMLGRAPQELLGKNLWELWPHASDSPFGATFRRAVAENVTLQVEAFYPEPLNAWFEVRCYPSPEGLSLFFTNTTERKQAEERVRLLESATMQTHDGIVILKVSGEDACCQSPVFANPAFERMTGFTFEDLQQGALRALYDPRSNPHVRTNRLAGFRKACPTKLEQPVRRKDGSEFPAEWSFRPLAGDDGNYTHCVWTLRDITQRKHAEEESLLFSSIVQSSDDAIICKNLDGIILTWNQGAERIYGYTSQEIVGQSVSILIPPDLEFELPLLFDALRRGAKVEHYETERVRKDGARIFVSLTMSPLKDDEQRIVGASVVGRDITERKQAEKALALSEERYRSLTSVTSQIVWTTNPQGDFVDDVPPWREFTGQSLEEIEGRGWINALHPDDRERTCDLWSRSIKNRSYYNTGYRLRRHDGEYRYMAVNGVPVLERDGTIREWVGTCADITERVRAEEEVRNLNGQLEKRVVERTAELEVDQPRAREHADRARPNKRTPPVPGWTFDLK
jgi:PAS domain S-box-containing protein